MRWGLQRAYEERNTLGLSRGEFSNARPLWTPTPSGPRRDARLPILPEGTQVAVAMEVTVSDQAQKALDLRKIVAVSTTPQGKNVSAVHRARPFIVSEHLEREQVSTRRHREPHVGEDFDRLGSVYDLGLDSRRCKEQIDDDAPIALAWWNESDCCQALSALMLEKHCDTKPRCGEIANQRLSIAVIADEHSKVEVTCEPWFCSSGHSESAEQRKATASGVKISCNLAQDTRESIHLRTRTGPAASPKGAPGRSRSHA